MRDCIGCCNGNDLPDGETCQMCGYQHPKPEPWKETPPPEGTLARAVWDARGGPAPTPFKGYA